MKETFSFIIFDFKEIISDVATMEVRYNEEHLGLLILFHYRVYIIPISETPYFIVATLTLSEVYETLYAKGIHNALNSIKFNGSSYHFFTLHTTLLFFLTMH